MRIAIFSSKPYDRATLGEANAALGESHELIFFEPRLDELTVRLAAGYDVVCAFVNDRLTDAVIAALAAGGTRLIAMRCAGYNNVDLEAARAHGIPVVRVPAYSPYAVAEHAVALILDLNRNIHRAHNRVREGNFALEGLLGFDLNGKTVGVVGTGKIGAVFARIMAGFGCRVVAHDLYPDAALEAAGTRYVALEEVFAEADIISLHCPLTPQTHHLVNAGTLALMKRGVMLINTSRGALIDTRAVIEGLKSGALGYLGLDVYEEEGDLFFEDLSSTVIGDDVFSRLLTFPNVTITGHQAFFTREALENIAQTTLENVGAFERDGTAANAV
ncbi:2-hydroxyacid dehydrogenase [soil metagenome]